MHKRDQEREKREAKRDADKAEQRAKLVDALKEKEGLKEKELNEWRQRYEANVSDIKGRLGEIKLCLNSKADDVFNRTEHSKFYRFKDDHESRIVRIETKQQDAEKGAQ